MRDIWRMLLRIPAAYLAASIAASMVMILSAGVEPNAGEPPSDFIAKLIVLSLIASMFVGAVAAVPALILIILAEGFGWRSLILHLLMGAGIGFTAFLMNIGGPSEISDNISIGGGAGAVAGFVYWAIAGRKAGIARHKPQ